MTTLNNEERRIDIKYVNFLDFQIQVDGKVSGENPLSLDETIKRLESLGLNSVEINWLTLNAVAGK